MPISETSWQLVFIDGLFLVLAGGLALWFKAWLGRQSEAFDRRFSALEAQQAGLERLGKRLTKALETIEGSRPGAGRGRPPRKKSTPLVATETDSGHTRARTLLAKGVAPDEVARTLDIGIAEVEIVRRVMRYEREN
jgi:hypothetical protein